MIKEVRKVKSKTVASYVRQMQYLGKLKIYSGTKGYVAYDTQELKDLRKSAKRGRPQKKQDKSRNSRQTNKNENRGNFEP